MEWKYRDMIIMNTLKTICPLCEMPYTKECPEKQGMCEACFDSENDGYEFVEFDEKLYGWDI